MKLNIARSISKSITVLMSTTNQNPLWTFSGWMEVSESPKSLANSPSISPCKVSSRKNWNLTNHSEKNTLIELQAISSSMKSILSYFQPLYQAGNDVYSNANFLMTYLFSLFSSCLLNFMIKTLFYISSLFLTIFADKLNLFKR